MNFSFDAISGAAHIRVPAVGPRLKALARSASLGLKQVWSRLAPVEPRWLVLVSMLLLVTGVVLVGLLAQRSQGQLVASSELVTHMMEVEERSRALMTGVVGAEKAVRTYVVSGNREDVLPYRATLDTLPDELARVRELTRSNRAQRANLDRLDALANECLDLLGRIIAIHDSGDRETAFALLLAGHVPRLMDVIRSSSALIVLEEQHAMAVRQQKLAGDAAVGRASLVFVVIVTGVFVVAVLVLAFQLSKLRHLARMCAWSRTIEYQGEWLSFEEYLSRRFNIDTTHGISPAEAAKMRAAVPAG